MPPDDHGIPLVISARYLLLLRHQFQVFRKWVCPSIPEAVKSLRIEMRDVLARFSTGVRGGLSRGPDHHLLLGQAVFPSRHFKCVLGNRPLRN